ncbi:MAG: hypothetical protein PSX71_13125 [bacterium]|nr:hypothetical protein [bacterium]
MKNKNTDSLFTGRKPAETGLAFFVFFLPLTLIAALVLAINDGHFIYTLDDPYIHIELAKNIYNGVYGINPNEFSAPSSSILWPFLIAPFSILGKSIAYVPLFLNVVFSFLTFTIISRMLDGTARQYKAAILIGWFMATNFYGLVFNGMEHCLQVFLTSVIAISVIKREFKGELATSLPVYLALFFLPLVRYEGLAISMPVLLYLFFKGERKNAIICGAAICTAIAAFSLFLHHIGCGFLPSSIIAKSNTSGLSSVVENAVNQIHGYKRTIILIVAMCFIFKDRKSLVFLLVTTTTLHILLGKSGWYGRYEIYWLTFIGLFFMFNCIEHMSPRNTAIIFGLLPLAYANLVYPTITTPMASANIYNQQYRMSMIARKLDEPVAVNDLGLVALNTDKYVLDLWGLGSLEALTLRRSEKGPAWIKGLMDRKNVRYAFVYDGWFPEKPDNWIRVAAMKLSIPRVTAAQDTVLFFATDLESAQKLRSVIRAYDKENPSKKFAVSYSF